MDNLKRETSLLLRLYNDRNQYKHASSAMSLIEYLNNTNAGQTLIKDFGYTRYDDIYTKLHSMRTPKIYYGAGDGLLYDFYTHNGQKLVRLDGWGNVTKSKIYIGQKWPN